MDPYIVLGIPGNADAFQIKKAYYNAVKHCHPDRFAGTPEYNDAQEMLKKVNLAYDMLAGKVRADFRADFAQAASGEQAADDEHYDGIEYDRHALKYAYDLAMERRIKEALLLLSKTKRRGAQWHYAHAVCGRKAGNIAAALADIEIAMKLEPGNAAYRDEWRSIIALRSKRRKRAAFAGAAAAVAVTVVVVASI